MGTNKHKRSSERKTTSKSSGKKEEVAEEKSYDVATPRSLATGSLVTMSQLTSIIMIAISFQYVWAMRQVLYESKDCNTYLHPSAQQETQSEGQSCSHADLLLLMAKLHSGYISEILVSLIIFFLCWSEPALLLQFHAILCSSPLLTTVIALQLTKDFIDPGFAGKLGMMVTIILLLTAASLYGSRLSPQQPIKIDVLNATLWTAMVAFGWEAYKFFSAGPSGFLSVTQQEPSPASLALMAFLAIDQATLVGICIFGIVFLSDSSKRVSSVRGAAGNL